MLESAVARILNQLLGKYVVHLDTENLNVGIFSGQVQLSDLKLKPEALYELKLPIKVHAGTIGSIRMQIPWTSLWKQAIVVTIEDILIVARPIIGTQTCDDYETNKRLLRAFKKQVLKELQNHQSGFLSNLIGGPHLFCNYLLDNIINNVQLTINNVHVRYESFEDALTMGLCIGSITSENTNNKWKPCPGYKSTENMIYHLIKIEALCCYCNPTGPNYTWDNVKNSENVYYEWKNAMLASLQNYSILGEEFHFFLRPMGIKMKMTVSKDPQSDNKIFKVLNDIIMHDLNVHLSHAQYEALKRLENSFRRMNLAWNFLPQRPISQELWKSYWKYACEVVLEERIRPYTWGRIRKVRENVKKYTKLYEKHLSNPSDTELKLDLQQYEDKLSIANIIVARQTAKLRVGFDPISHHEKSFWDLLPSPERQTLCEHLGYVNPQSREFIDYIYNLRIGNTSLTFTNKKEREILVLTLTQIITSYQPKLFDESRQRIYEKGCLKIEGCILEGANLEEHLVPIASSNHLGQNCPAYFLKVDWEIPEGEIVEDIKCKINFTLEQIEIIYDKYAYDEIGAFFHSNRLTKKIENFQEKFQWFEEKLLDFWDFNLNIGIPYLIIPQSGKPSEKMDPVLVVDLGQIKVTTELCNLSKLNENLTQMELEELMYSRFHMTWKDIQILFCLPDVNDLGWRSNLKEKDTNMHLIPKTLLKLSFGRCIEKTKTLPVKKLNINVPTLKLNFSERKILKMLIFLDEFKNVIKLTKTVCTSKKNSLKAPEIFPETLSIEDLKNIESKVWTKRNQAKSSKMLKTMKQKSILILEKCEAKFDNNEQWARCVDLPGLEDNISPNNTIKTIYRIVVTDVQIAFSRSGNESLVDQPYLSLKLGLLTADLALMTYGPACQLTLGNLILTDKLHTTSSGQYLDLIHSQFPSETDTLTVLYRKVTADCPDFQSHFHGVETSLVADLGAIHLNMHQEALKTILKYCHDFFQECKEFQNKPNINQLYKTISQSSTEIFNELMKTSQAPIPTGCIKFSHSFRLSDLTLIIFDSDFDILNLHLSGLEIDFLFRANERFVFRAYLGHINAESTADASLYPKILSTDDDKVFELKYVRFAEAVPVNGEQDTFSTNGSFKLQIEQFHVILVYKLFVQLQRFFKNLEAGEYVKNIWIDCSKKISALTESLNKSTKLINLDIGIKGPVLLVPQAVCSPNVLIIDSGKLIVENFFKNYQTELIENILVKLNNIMVSRGVFNINGSMQAQETIVEPFNMQFDIKRFILQNRMLKNVWEVDGLTENINITLGQKDLTLLIKISDENQRLFMADIFDNQNEANEETVRSLEAFFVTGESKANHVTTKFSIEAIDVLLFFDSTELLSSPIRDINQSLCHLKLKDFNFCSVIYSDGSSDGKVNLDSLNVDELGPEIVNANINKPILFSPLDDYNKNTNCNITINKPPVIDVTYHINRNKDKSIDIIIGRLTWALSVPFCEKFALFILECLPKLETTQSGIINFGYVSDIKPPAKVSERGLTIALRINRPEFQLIVESAQKRRRFFATKCEILCDYSRHATTTNFVLSLSGLHTVYCDYENFSGSSMERYAILRQCDVELSSNCKEKGHRHKITLTVSSIYLQFSNKIVHSINDVLNDIVEHFKITEEIQRRESTKSNPSEDLWEPKRLPEIWNANPTEISSNEDLNIHQIFLIPKTEVIVILELETLPIFVCKSTFELSMTDWSTLLNCTCEMMLQANYFNVGKQKWEPFVDPVVLAEGLYKPWEICLKVFEDKSHPILVPNEQKQRSITKTGNKNAVSDDCEDEIEDSGEDMVYLESENTIFPGRNSRRVKTSLSTFLDDSSDSENDDGSMEKLAAAISDLFTGDWNESDVSDLDDSSESEPEDTVPTYDEALNAQKLDYFQKAYFLVLDSKETLNFTVTPAFIKVFNDLLISYTNKTVSIVQSTDRFLNLVNDIGPQSRIEIYEKKSLDNSPSTKEEDSLLLTKTYEKEDSCPNSPSKDVDTESLLTDFDADILKSLEFLYDFETINSLDFAPSSTGQLYEKINKNQMKIYIPGFQGIQTSCPRKDIVKLLKIHPLNSSQLPLTSYYIAYKSTMSKHGMSVCVSSPLQIKNETCYPLSILYQPSVLQQMNLEPIGDVVNPFETTMRIIVVEPHETYNIPLQVAYHCKLFVLPTYAEGKYVCPKGIWWKDLITDFETPRNYNCNLKDLDTNEQYDSIFALRIVLSNNFDVKLKHPNIPNYVIRLLPSLKFQNYLPYPMIVDCDTRSIKIEPGEYSDMYSLNLLNDHKLSLRIFTYDSKVYTGTLTLSPNLEEKVLTLVGDEDQVSISVKTEREESCHLIFYAPYWIINKTCLPLQIKASSGNSIYKSSAAENIILFTFKRHGRQTLKVRVYQSEWSSEFGLDCPQSTGLIVCKDHERKKRYGFLLDVQLSETCPHFTKLVTLIPNFLVTNNTEKKLRFMEHNDKTDLWIDLLPKQTLCFWPETSSMQMYVKFNDGKLSSHAFNIAVCGTTLLRMDKGGSLTVHVRGGSENPFSIIFENYCQGDAPLLVKNACQDLFIKIQQQGQSPVSLVSPLNSILYTWDEPTKSHLVFWNIYNHKHSGFVLNLDQDNFGKERLNGQNFSSNFLSSSDDSDNSSTNTTTTTKSKKTKEKPQIIYWITYTESKQKTLLFTQDSNIFDQIYQKVFTELCSLEVYLSLSGLSTSFFGNSQREQLHVSMSDIPATWEVNVGHKWKILTLELASWLEDRYKQNHKKCQLKDYVHVDFEKMFMLRPFYAELRRTYCPAITLHIRKGPTLKYFNFKARQIQIDDKINGREVILSALSNEILKCSPPFVQISGLFQMPGIWKWMKVQVMDFRLQLKKNLIQNVLAGFSACKLLQNKSGNFRADLARIKLPIEGLNSIKDKQVLVEMLEMNRFQVLVSVSNRNGDQSITHSVIWLFFPMNLTPYMPSEGAKHKISPIQLKHLQVDNHWDLCRFVGSHVKTNFLQQYYAQILGLQVLVNPYSVTFQVFDKDFKLSSSKIADKIEYSLDCLLANINMSSVALEQCITETIAHQNLELRLLRPRNYRSTIRSNLPTKIVNWTLRNFYPCITLVLNQIVSRSFSSGASTSADGETFFKGTGKALLPLVARYPSDDKSNSLQISLEALKRACLLGEPLETHVRLTRYSNLHLGLRPFSVYESMGNFLLESISGSRFAMDNYWTHCALDQSGRAIILVTLEHVIKINKWRLWGPWELEWSIDLDEVIAVPKIVDSKLLLDIKNNQDEKYRDDNLRDGQLIIEGDNDVLQWLQSHIEQAMVLSMEDKAWIFN